MSTFDLNYILELLNNELRESIKEMKSMPDGFLNLCSKGKKKKYYHEYRYNGRRKRKTISIDSNRLGELARKRYLKKRIKNLKDEIKYIERITKKYKSNSMESIIQDFPKVYKSIPRQMFYPPEVREAIIWGNEPYYQDDEYLHHNKVPTKCGIKVKSKTEKDIVEALFDEGIPFHYEEVLYIDNKKIAPDFTIRRLSDGEVVYWEHFGRMHEARYRRNFFWKMSMYEKEGIIPGKNLIVTFEGGDQYVSRSEIYAIINSKLK